MTKDDYITWWRDRYNNLVSTLIRAVDGEPVSFDDNDEFPHSDGAKMLLERITSLSAEVRLLTISLTSIANTKRNIPMNIRGIARDALASVSGSPTPTVCEWFEDDDGWHGSCGKDWEFIDDGPKENGINFCMDCGRPVIITTDTDWADTADSRLDLNGCCGSENGTVTDFGEEICADCGAPVVIESADESGQTENSE